MVLLEPDPRQEHQALLFVLHRVVADAVHHAVQVAVAGVGEAFHFDRGRLSRPHEADVFVFDLRFDFQRFVPRHHRQQRLRFGDHAADGVDGQLLHAASHRRGEPGQRLALAGLFLVFAVLAHLFARFAQFVEGVAAEVGLQRLAFLCLPSDGGVEFLQPALLAGQVASLFDARLLFVEVGVLGDEVLGQQVLVVVFARFGDAGGGLQLAHLLAGGGVFGLALTQGGVQRFELGLIAAPLAQRQAFFGQPLAVGDAGGGRQLRQPAAVQRGQQRLVARRGQRGGGVGIVGFLLVGAGAGGIQFDQHLPGLDLLAVAHVDGFDHAGFQRLQDFGAAAADGLAAGDGDDVELAQRGP